MKPLFLPLVLLAAATLAACNPATDFASDEAGTFAASMDVAEPGIPAEESWTADAGDASCPCFSRRSLDSVEGMTVAESIEMADYYLFFDVFGYYELDPRRTEARALVSTPAGPFEEVAAVYITPGANDELFLVCHRQEVVVDPVTTELEYRYTTLAPTVEEAEACRRDVYASVGAQEACQGGACGMEYTKEQLDPDYPLYHDGNVRTPESLLDAMRARVEAVERMLRVPA